MCLTCWEEYGSPQLLTPEVEAAKDLIVAVYREHPTGGAGHVVLDDWNLEDSSIRRALDQPDIDEITTRCLTTLLGMSLEDRASALYHTDLN